MRFFILILSLVFFWSCRTENTSSSILEYELNINPEDFSSIEEFRKTALKRKITTEKEKVYFYSSDSSQKYRLKGDWTDHIKRDKWSLKIKSDSLLFDNKVYSILAPHTRSYLRSYFLHSLLKEADIICTQIEAVSFNSNHFKDGIYLFEDHFTDQFLRKNNLPQSTIVAINEEAIWEMRITDKGVSFEKESSIPVELISDLKIYTHSKYDEKALNLFNDFRHGVKSVKQVFDLEKLAKSYAICSILKGYHYQAWHNVRFYFNPTSQLLEPIIYDSFGESLNEADDWFRGASPGHHQKVFYYLFLRDEDFQKTLLKYLNIYTQKDELEKLVHHSLEKTMSLSDQILMVDSLFIPFDSTYFKSNFNRIRKHLKSFTWHSDYDKSLNISPKQFTNLTHDTTLLKYFIKTGSISNQSYIISYFPDTVEYFWKGNVITLPAYNFQSYPDTLFINQ